MKALGFKHLNSDARIFVCQEGPNLILAVVYIDDAIFIGRNKKLTSEKKALFMAKWGLEAYSDSDWAADKIWRCSITGIFFKLASGIIC